MPITLTIPTLGKPESVKDAVISILSTEWPLSTRKIYNSVKKEGLDVSYQAVHKTLKLLEKAGVLEKIGGNYRISEEWIEKTEEFISALKERYSSRKNQVGLENDSQFVFHTLFEVDKFLVEFAERLVEKKIGGENRQRIASGMPSLETFLATFVPRQKGLQKDEGFYYLC
jgi:DNA-binding PadR family transcriptional regulator